MSFCDAIRSALTALAQPFIRLPALINIVGRATLHTPLKAIMSFPYTPAQIATGKEIWDTLGAERPKWSDVTKASLLGNTVGEDALILKLVGDHGMAKGMGQWWPYRRHVILQHTGIDVETASPAEQTKALLAEISAPWAAPYNHVEQKLLAQPDIMQAKVGVWVREFERSQNQASDIAKRTTYANEFLAYARGKWVAKKIG